MLGNCLAASRWARSGPRMSNSAKRSAPLFKQLHVLEDKIATLPAADDAMTAAESVEHCTVQVAYWRLSMAIASMQWMDTALSDEAREKSREWLKLATDQAGEWEKRKSVAQKNLIDDRLAELQRQLAFLLKAGDTLEDEGLVT